MTGDDFALTAGWGHLGQGETVMPGQGRVVGRAYTLEERAALGEVVSTLGGMTFDVYLNNRATGATSPPRLDLQGRRLPGPQEVAVIPRASVLGRAMTPEECSASRIQLGG